MNKCLACGRENYASNVLSGICAWCGHNANVDKQELSPGTDTNDGTKTYQVKIDMGLTEKQAEDLVDRVIMPFLFPLVTRG